MEKITPIEPIKKEDYDKYLNNPPMTKGEILFDKITEHQCHSIAPFEVFSRMSKAADGAMSDFAKQEAIEFAEWIGAEGYVNYDGYDRWIAMHQNTNVYETKALYNLFLQSKEK